MPPLGTALSAAALLLATSAAVASCAPPASSSGCDGSACGGSGGGAGNALDATAGTGGGLPGLVADYEFEEGMGSVALDSSGNFNNAGLVGQVTWGAMGHAGMDTSFGGGYIILPPGILDQARAFSFVAWVKLRTDRVWQRIFDFGANTTTYLFLTPHSADGTFRFAITRNGPNNGNEQRLDGPMPLPTGVWEHVAVVLTGASGTLYLNGQIVATDTGVTLRPVDVTMGNEWFGRSEFNPPDPFFDGEIDQVRIYDRALSGDEVVALFNPP